MRILEPQPLHGPSPGVTSLLVRSIGGHRRPPDALIEDGQFSKLVMVAVGGQGVLAVHPGSARPASERRPAIPLLSRRTLLAFGGSEKRAHTDSAPGDRELSSGVQGSAFADLPGDRGSGPRAVRGALAAGLYLASAQLGHRDGARRTRGRGSSGRAHACPALAPERTTDRSMSSRQSSPKEAPSTQWAPSVP
jgi:hypothetical protein